MARRLSNTGRIAKARAEAAATMSEKEAKKKAAKKTTKKAAKKTTKKAAKKTTKKATKKAAKKTARKRTAKAPQRMKIIWGVAKHGHDPVSTFAYRDQAKAAAEAAKKGDAFSVHRLRVPMEEDE